MANQLIEITKHQEEDKSGNDIQRFGLKKASKPYNKQLTGQNAQKLDKQLLIEKQKSENPVKIDDSIGIIGSGIQKNSKPTTTNMKGKQSGKNQGDYGSQAVNQRGQIGSSKRLS